MAENMWGDLATALVIIGAINWGLVGILDFNLVTAITDVVGGELLATIVYALVGISGLGAGYDRWLAEDE